MRCSAERSLEWAIHRNGEAAAGPLHCPLRSAAPRTPGLRGCSCCLCGPSTAQRGPRRPPLRPYPGLSDGAGAVTGPAAGGAAAPQRAAQQDPPGAASRSAALPAPAPLGTGQAGRARRPGAFRHTHTSTPHGRRVPARPGPAPLPLTCRRLPAGCAPRPARPQLCAAHCACALPPCARSQRPGAGPGARGGAPVGAGAGCRCACGQPP